MHGSPLRPALSESLRHACVRRFPRSIEPLGSNAALCDLAPPASRGSIELADRHYVLLAAKKVLPALPSLSRGFEEAVTRFCFWGDVDMRADRVLLPPLM